MNNSTPTKSPEMEFKEKKSKELDSLIAPYDLQKPAIKDFLSSTIDEILSCVPEEAPKLIDVLHTEAETEHNIPLRARISGFNSCRQQFYENIKNKLK